MVKVVKTANTDILKVLKPSSEVLENLTQDFHTMLRSREQAQNPSIKITCFVKELPVSKAGKTFMVYREVSFLDVSLLIVIRLSHLGQLR